MAEGAKGAVYVSLSRSKRLCYFPCNQRGKWLVEPYKDHGKLGTQRGIFFSCLEHRDRLIGQFVEGWNIEVVFE